MKCFILSPFRDPFDEYYREIISPAIRGLGLNVMRADEIYGVRPIMDDIVQGIIDADVIIADVTTRNPNVNYELGMAHALGKPVVIISQSVEDIPFDYQHIRVIIYNTKGARWAAELKKHLRATVEDIVAGEVRWTPKTGQPDKVYNGSRRQPIRRSRR